MAQYLEIKNFPFLTAEEFRDACHYLDRSYSRAALGILRSQFSLAIHRVSFNDDLTWIRIVRPIMLSQTDDTQLSRDLEKLCWGGEGGGQMDIDEGERRALMDVDAEDADIETTQHQYSNTQSPERTPQSGENSPPGYALESQQPWVAYEIHRHETYQMPCLWFSLHGLPPDTKEFDIESVYRYLTPDHLKAHLRAVGGFSAAPHPLTGVPCFFVHPCMTNEVMAEFNGQCHLDIYLMIWLGMAGAAVGLNIPLAMASTVHDPE